MDPDSLVEAALDVARKADIILYVGGLNKTHQQDCEGGDRQHYGLPFGQPELIEQLIEINDQIAVILVSGNAVEMPWLDDVRGVMQAWYLGSETGLPWPISSAETTASGKLPFSFPKKLETMRSPLAKYPTRNSIIPVLKTSSSGIAARRKIEPEFAFGFICPSSFDLGKAPE